jgi:hypothetical protein
LLYLAQQPDVGAYLEAIGVPSGKTVPLPDDVKRRIAELREQRSGELSLRED